MEALLGPGGGRPAAQNIIHAELFDAARTGGWIGCRRARCCVCAAASAAAETTAIAHTYGNFRSILSFLGSGRNLGCCQGPFSGRRPRDCPKDFPGSSAREI